MPWHLHAPQHTGRDVRPGPLDLVNLIAKKNSWTLQIHGADAVRRFGLSTQMPVILVYYTSGPSRSISLGKADIRLVHAAPMVMQRAGTKVGMAISALFYLGNAQALAEAARHVLLSSNRVVLVDPYFEAKPRCCKVLQAMIRVCSENGHQLTEVVIYTAKGTPKRHANHDVAAYEKLLSGDLAQDINLRIIMLSAESLGQDFHARYLFSQRAGLRFDRGFVEPEDHAQRDHLTDVACLDEGRVAELNNRYLGTEDDLADAESIFLSSK